MNKCSLDCYKPSVHFQISKKVDFGKFYQCSHCFYEGEAFQMSLLFHFHWCHPCTIITLLHYHYFLISQSHLLFYWVPAPHPTWRSKPVSSLANILIFLIFFLSLKHGFCPENSGLDSLFSRYSVLFCLALNFFLENFCKRFLKKVTHEKQ